MTHFKTLATTMYQLSDTMGDHAWQAGRAIDLLLENSEQHVYAARMMATAVLLAAKRLGIVRQDLDGLTGERVCELLGYIERMAARAVPPPMHSDSEQIPARFKESIEATVGYVDGWNNCRAALDEVKP